MFGYLARKVFGSANDRIIKSVQKVVTQVNCFEDEVKHLTDGELSNKTIIFRERILSGDSLELIMPEAFAVVREAARRVLGMRHFDVQLIGGIILHQGKIAEMKTGEGKTLVATAPVYLNALLGKGVHVVTVNDYLAKRDSEWMGALYNFLGLSVGCITNDIVDEARKEAYASDITYGTNNEFGFDYLRDNLKYDKNEVMQRPFHYAIVDEVDSILIDEARTPLIISGTTDCNSELYNKINEIVQFFKDEDLEIDEKSRSVNLTEKGHVLAEEILKKYDIISNDNGLYSSENLVILHHLNQSLKAHKIFKRDVDYIVKSDRVMIIDEFTGRIMDGRRYSEGMHQALEAKEQLPIQNENQTLASITFQNYFRMYPKLAGMTGTALTEADEFSDIYSLQVVSVPTHLEIRRQDEDDAVYKTVEEKYDAIIEEIKDAHAKQQPILVGTASIAKSEHISSLLKKENIKHSVLNAKYHAQEASIISRAGESGAITIATNMAGRGTDIMLGGNDQELLKKNADTILLKKLQDDILRSRERVLESGGLLVIGTERHESRRIDNQLRGRAGRQGDIGRTKFFLSLEDDLMKLFGSEKLGGMLTRLGLKKGEAIVHPWITKSLEKAQQKVEMRNYEIRKNLLRFDDVVNEQRKIIYAERADILRNDQMHELLIELIENVIIYVLRRYIPEKSYQEEWDIEGTEGEFKRVFGLSLDLKGLISQSEVEITEKQLVGIINAASCEQMEKMLSIEGAESYNNLLRIVFLQSLDKLWQEHLNALDHLRGGISLRAYAQKDPLNEYKIESFKLFQLMREELDELRVANCLRVSAAHQASRSKDLDSQNGNLRVAKISRNRLCSCGSGKKYKHCHGIIS